MMKRLVIAALFAFNPAIAQMQAPRAPALRDPFYWLGEFNKASTVMVVERGIVTPELGTVIAKAVSQVIADGDRQGARRPADYLQYEPLLVAIAGPDVTRMHSGRCRQDILATTRRVMQRDRLLLLMGAMNEARARLIAQIPFAEAQRIFGEFAAAFPGSGTTLPLTEAQFRTSLSARGMIDASQGLGGPQPAQVARLLTEAQTRLNADEGWLQDRNTALSAATDRLNQAFAAVAAHR